MKSIELNGFDLSDAGHAGGDHATTGIFLYGGVGVLSFDRHQCDNRHVRQPDAVPDRDRRRRTRRSRFSRRSSSTASTTWSSTARRQSIPTTPVTTPSVAVHDQRRDPQLRHRLGHPGIGRRLDSSSSFPPVGTTGRTSSRRRRSTTLNVHGSAKNFTVSRSPMPFSSEVERAQLPAQGDVRRQRRRRRHRRQRQDRQARRSSGDSATRPVCSPASRSQRPVGADDDLRDAPGHDRLSRRGPLGGTIRAKSIKKLTVRPANVLVQTAQNPNLVQLGEQGFPTYAASPGYSLTNAVGHHVGVDRQREHPGTPLNTEIKTGFDYTVVCRRTRGERAEPARSPLMMRAT